LVSGAEVTQEEVVPTHTEFVVSTEPTITLQPVEVSDSVLDSPAIKTACELPAAEATAEPAAEPQSDDSDETSSSASLEDSN